MRKFNINKMVKVKLTSKGKEIHKQRYDKYNHSIEYTPPKEDENGYSDFQMWELMNIFGEHTSIGLDQCFEATILIDD